MKRKKQTADKSRATEKPQPTKKNLYDPLIREFFKEWKKVSTDEELDQEERQRWIRFFQQQSSDYVDKLLRGLRLLEKRFGKDNRH